MNRYVLSSGTIACSALLLYSWAQSSASNPQSNGCSDQANAAKAPNQVSTAKKHCLSKAMLAMHPSNPDIIPNLQWGDRDNGKLPTNLETVYGDLLKRAQASADRDQLAAAMTDLAGIPKNSRHYDMAQRLQEDWSRELLRQATMRCQQAEVTTAISLLNAIPASSQVRDRATELQQRWQQQANLLSQATTAYRSSNWQQAIDSIKGLEGSPMYNSLPVQEMLQQAMTKLYEPDQALLQIATVDLPTAQLPLK